MKKLILVPTDFSNNALVAAKYALGLARQNEYNIHFLHSYLPFTSAFQTPSANETDEKRAQLAAEKGLSEFVEKIAVTGEVSITSSISKGNLIVSLSQYLYENPVGTIIMGTHGISGTRKDVLGSNTYDVAKSVSTPLIVVPEDTAEFRLNNVVFFTDYQNNDSQTLKAFKQIVGGKEKRSTVVHIIQEAVTDPNPHNLKLQEWKHHLEKEAGYEFLETHIVAEKENLNIVNSVIDDLDADLTLLTLVEGRGFFEKLFHKSLAREILLNPKRPIFLNTGS